MSALPSATAVGDPASPKLSRLLPMARPRSNTMYTMLCPLTPLLKSNVPTPHAVQRNRGLESKLAPGRQLGRELEENRREGVLEAGAVQEEKVAVAEAGDGRRGGVKKRLKAEGDRAQARTKRQHAMARRGEAPEITMLQCSESGSTLET